MTPTLSRIRELWPQTQPYLLPRQTVIEIPNVGRDDLARLFASLGFNRGVEIGTERGLYAETLLRANPDLHLTCVDPYLAYRGYREHTSQDKLDGFFVGACQRLVATGGNVQIVRRASAEVAQYFPDGSFDFTYIDGNHSLLHVIQDLCLWTPKVRRGGIVAGHDWISRKDPALNMHVVEAVTAYVHAYRIAPLFVLGRKEIREGEIRDPVRSWMFVKE